MLDCLGNKDLKTLGARFACRGNNYTPVVIKNDLEVFATLSVNVVYLTTSLLCFLLQEQ